jgi:hypothetical protein
MFDSVYIICITDKQKIHKKIYLTGLYQAHLSCTDKIYNSKLFYELKYAKKCKKKINRLYGNKYYKNIQILKRNKLFMIIYKFIKEISGYKKYNDLITIYKNR